MGGPAGLGWQLLGESGGSILGKDGSTQSALGREHPVWMNGSARCVRWDGNTQWAQWELPAGPFCELPEGHSGSFQWVPMGAPSQVGWENSLERMGRPSLFGWEHLVELDGEPTGVGWELPG